MNHSACVVRLPDRRSEQRPLRVELEVGLAPGFVTAVGLRWCSCGTSIWRRINDEIKAMWADELEDDLVRLWLKRGRCTALMKYLTKATNRPQVIEREWA